MATSNGSDELHTNPARDSGASSVSPPSADSPHAAPTPASASATGLDEPASGTALADDPVLSTEPELPNDQAPTSGSSQEAAGASAEPSDGPNPDPATHARGRNWLGYVAFVSGAFAVSLPAVAVGHLGLSAAKRGEASNRDFALAGLILGYIGLIVTAVGVWLFVADPTSPARVDIQAQQDVAAVGAAAATAAIETEQRPEVTLTDSGYGVAGEHIETHLLGERTLTLTGEGMAGWCLDIAYEGGEHPAFSYTATSGMAEGRCAP